MRLRDERDLLQAEVAELKALRDVLTPREIPAVPGWEISARYLAASALAGDFHLVAPDGDGTTVVAIGDVAGAGQDTTATLDALLQITPDLAAGTPTDDVCLLALRRR
jgi:serine phosphatase RsbU (regulator of sigma subunit)